MTDAFLKGADPLGPIDDQDVHTLAVLSELWGAADPVPAGLVDEVKFALALQAMKAELAELQESPPVPAGVRSDYVQAPTLTFSADSLSAMVTLSLSTGGTVQIDGWVTGPQGPVRVEVRAESRTTSTMTDSEGQFAIASHPRGLVRFVFFPVGNTQPPVMTPLVEI